MVNSLERTKAEIRKGLGTEQKVRLLYRKYSKNFMTPNIMKTKFIGNRVIELSYGSGIKRGTTIYGVSEIKLQKGKLRTTERGKPFDNLNKAKTYYNKLIKGV